MLNIFKRVYSSPFSSFIVCPLHNLRSIITVTTHRNPLLTRESLCRGMSGGHIMQEKTVTQQGIRLAKEGKIKPCLMRFCNIYIILCEIFKDKWSIITMGYDIINI